VRQVSGAISHFVGVFSDLTQIKQARERIEFLAWHDALTTLPNRAYLIEHLHHALYQQTAEPPTHALLLIGLDRFKTITETLGPVVGDQLLIETAERLRWAGAGFLARLGGDTFALFMAMPEGQAQATAVARELLTRLSQPFEIATRRLILTASIGIGLTHGEARDAEALIRHAERAMYEAKQRGRNHMYFYTPELTEGAVERLWLETALRRAVGYQRIQLYYQPQFDLNTGRLVGLEALARWEHPELGRIPPARFIPLAEEIGLITEIDVWMLGQACRQLADWDARGFHVPRVAVNFSVLDIVREGLVDKVRDALSAHALDPRRLELEVTESILVQDSARIRATLATLTASGCALAIDDFGTGYSNLGYLKLLPLTRLKIDRSFVCDIERDGNNEAIVRAMIALANSLGLEILAEGVETNAQADFLRHAGCQLVQGYLYVPALPATQLEARWRATGMDIQTALARNRSISPEASRGSDNNQPCP
jgi:diguanylate cyclase (GGDEF)-like protein